MNEKLKQSLQGRLSGMRWGEREQAEVFRQIHRKELQDVKHLKRGTGMLAVAIAMLFIMMGAAFALTQHHQPEDVRVAGQTAEPTFVPVPTAQYENEYFTLTIDSAGCEAGEAAFTATIRLKDAEQHMLMLAGHTPPGDPARTPICIELNGGVTTLMPDGIPMVLGSFSHDPQVLNMTHDAAVLHMTCSVHTMDAMEATLYVSFGDPATGAERSDKLSFPLLNADSVIEVLLEDEFITATLVETTLAGDQGLFVIELTPSKPWYTLNRSEADKATLTVHAEPMLFYASDSRDEVLGMVDGREPPAGELPILMEETPQGLRCTVQGTLPTGYDTLTAYGVITVYSEAAVMHNDTSRLHYAELILPFSMREAHLFATPTPEPTPSPTPNPSPTSTPSPMPAADARPASAGKFLGGTEHVSVYLEDSWFDGFCAEITLRIRADDAADRLAIVPNTGEQPSESTWVVQLEGSWNDYYRSVITPTLTLEATGDVIAHLTYMDLCATSTDRFSLPVTLTVINEQTWHKETKDLSLQPGISGNYARQPLRLLSSTSDNSFLQAGYITTDRYHYIGIMREYDGYYPSVIISDIQGNKIDAISRSYSTPAESLTLFPQQLFPFSGGDAINYSISVIRIDASIELPEIIQVRYDTADPQALPTFLLTSQPE